MRARQVSTPDLYNLSKIIFDGDNTGATDVSLLVREHLASTGGTIIFPEGTYQLADVDLVRDSDSFWVDSLGKVVIKYPSGSTAFIVNPTVGRVLDTQTAISAITEGATINADDYLDRITVTSVSGFTLDDDVLVGSNDSIPGDGGANFWAGEHNRIANIDTTNNYLYFTKKLKYASLYVTSPVVSRYNKTLTGTIKNLKFMAYGDYDDPAIYDREAAIDLAGVHQLVLENLTGENLWGQLLQIRGCIKARIDNIAGFVSPNLATYDPTETEITVTSATAANPAVFTSNSHPFTSNNTVVYVRSATGDWSVLNGKTFRITNTATNTFRLQNMDGTAVSSSGFGAGANTVKVSFADVTAFTYLINYYGPCGDCVAKNLYAEGFRHALSLDGRGASYSLSNRHLQGQPTGNIFDGVASFSGEGPPSDGHKEGSGNLRKNISVFFQVRGPHGASYGQDAGGRQIREHDANDDGYYQIGGGGGYRLAAIDHHTSPVHSLNNVVIKNTRSSGGADYAFLSLSQAAITNKPIVEAENWFVSNVARPYRFGASTTFRGGRHKIIGPNVRSICFEGANSDVSFDHVTIDYRRTTTGSNCRPIFVDDDGTNPYTGNVLRIGHLEIIAGDAATKPVNILDLSGTVSGVALALSIGKISLHNPSAVTPPSLCAVGDLPGLTLDYRGMDCIVLDVAAPQTTITTLLKASRRIHRPFIPAVYVATVDTASSSGTPTFDVNKNGSSVFGANKLSIDINETSSATAATPVTMATASLTAFVLDDIISVDVDTAGTGTAGGKVYIYGWFV